MAKRRFQLTEMQVNELIRAYANCKDGPTRTRYQAIRLYGTNYPTKEVLKITGCSRASLMDWCRRYRSDGVDGLMDGRVGGNRAKLKPEQLEGLSMQLHMYTPAEVFGPLAATPTGEFWTVPDLKRAIKQWYGVSYQSPSTYLRLFHLCGFSYQRPAKVYKSRRPAQIDEFEEQLEKN
jgi:transposase